MDEENPHDQDPCLYSFGIGYTKGILAGQIGLH